jgi:RNA polymerase sigma-70 factor (ECF subfamily)
LGRKETQERETSAASEHRLVEAARRGDPAAREQIVLQHQKMVYNLALRMMHNRDDAAVVLQETFLKAFAALPRFRSGSRLKTWIYRIATNEALQLLRRRGRQTFVDLEYVEADPERDFTYVAQKLDHSPLDLLENAELRERLESAIGRLPPKHRAAFILVDLEGLSLKEAARAVDGTIAALKTNLHRARIFLRDELATYLEGERHERS